MIHHLGIVVADFPRSSTLYEKCLAPLGIRRTEAEDEWGIFTTAPGEPFMWVGSVRPSFWTELHSPAGSPVHLAFQAPSREAVDAFYKAALAAGARDNGPPGIRKSWANFYSAFVIDLDGNNIEATLRE